MSVRYSYYPRKKKIQYGLLLALTEASKHYKGPEGINRSILTRGAKVLADGLGCTSQAIYNWQYVPKAKVMAVHKLTGVPLKELAPELFGKARSRRPYRLRS
jgi:hypothetical protein